MDPGTQKLVSCSASDRSLEFRSESDESESEIEIAGCFDLRIPRSEKMSGWNATESEADEMADTHW